MNSAELLSLIDDLEGDIDDVEEQLDPLLTESLSTTTKKLPLLDKAKLYVTVVYAIESLLFSMLSLAPIDKR
jgi:exosome complex protein LRP1